MNIWKRAWISILRRKVSSIVLLLIVFLLANVMLTTLTVTTSIKSTKQTVLKQYPPVATVEYNYESEKRDEKQRLTVEKAKQLYDETRDIVKVFDYSLNYYLNTNDGFKQSHIEGFDEENSMGVSEGSLMVCGTQLKTTSLVENGMAKMISGKGFSDSDINQGAPKIIITKQLAETNDLEVGSKVLLNRVLTEINKDNVSGEISSNHFFKEELEFEVVGIIEINEIENFIKTKELRNSLIGYSTLAMQADTIFIPNNYIYPLLEDDYTRVKEQSPQTYKSFYGEKRNQARPTYVLKDMNDLETFTQKAWKIYDKDSFAIQSAAREYEMMSKPMESMQNLLDLVFKITVGAGVLILSLVLCIFMYLRQKEMGVYLALGEKYKNIIGQLLIETLIIAFVGATLAIFTSMIFSEMLADNTMKSLLEPIDSLKGGMTYAGQINYGLTPELILQQYQGGFSLLALLLFYGTMSVTIVVSQLFTMLYLLRLNPKKILM